MPKIKFSKNFLRLFARLPAPIQQKVIKQIGLLEENPRHPSLQSKPIQGAEGIYEARVDQEYRMTYERENGDTLLLRVVAKHDQALEEIRQEYNEWKYHAEPGFQRVYSIIRMGESYD